MSKIQAAIITWLKERGYPARAYKSVVKTTKLHGKYAGYTVVIKNMRDAIEHVLGDEKNKQE